MSKESSGVILQADSQTQETRSFIKKVSKHIYEENYSPSLVSRFNKELGEALFLWLNRPIEKRIKYLYLDGVNLSLKRDRASREALLSAVEITETGDKEFLDFLLGRRESQVSSRESSFEA